MKIAPRKLMRTLFYKFAKLGCYLMPYSVGPLLVKREYSIIMGKKIDLKNPKNLIEKIFWMQFHTDTSLWTKCADKIEVRSYIKEKGLEHLLPKIYGIWENAEEINYASLPESFVLKTNNSSGQIIIVRNKSEINISEINRKLNRWKKEGYGYHNAQLHYLRIPAKIFAEELLIDPRSKQGESPIDYKIYCINGTPQCFFTVNSRNGSFHLGSFYDLEWNNISDEVMVKNSSYYGNVTLEKPEKLNEMLNYARILSSDFPQVRVDFYEIDGRVYFGELTFTTGYGFNTEEFYLKLGEMINLNKLARIR